MTYFCLLKRGHLKVIERKFIASTFPACWIQSYCTFFRNFHDVSEIESRHPILCVIVGESKLNPLSYRLYI